MSDIQNIQELLQPLSREEVISAIEGKGRAKRIPLYYHGWINPNVFGPETERASSYLREFPFDFEQIGIWIPDTYNAPAEDPSYRFLHRGPKESDVISRAYDSHCCFDMEEIDDIVADFPSADFPGIWAYKCGEKKKYRVLHWCYWLYERHWSLRGMENALTDFYLYPDETHKFYNALTNFYIGLILNSKKYNDIDGVFLTDDIGTQKAPFFSLDIFREFFKPYYKRLIDACHAAGLHVWFHTCGNVFDFLDDFLEIGFDVLHPIQKYTMDEAAVAAKAAGRMTILAGLDVQQIVPHGTPDEVRREVRYLMDAFARPEGRLMMTLGNAATPDIPIENLYALLDESVKYGALK